MRLTASNLFLLALGVSISPLVSGVPVIESELETTRRDVFRRAAAFIPLPKLPEPIPVVNPPKPIEPAPRPKPAEKPPPAGEPKPGENPVPISPGSVCKRAPGACDYTFSNINYAEKGEKLSGLLKSSLSNPQTTSHDFEAQFARYYLKEDRKTTPIVDKNIKIYLKDNHGIDLGQLFTQDTSWTRFQVFGATEKEVGNRASIVDVYVSLKHEAMLPTRLYKTDPKGSNPPKGEELYINIPEGERLPMSEWMFQMWKKAITDNASSGVKIGDMKRIITVDVINEDAKAIVDMARAEFANGAKSFTIKPEQTDAWNALAASSGGVSYHRMLIDHNGVDEFNRLVPIQVDILRLEAPELPVIIWTFVRAPN